MTDFRLATRRSPLALAQATLVVEALASVGYTASIVPIVSAGDRDRVTPVTALSEVGAFVRAVQAAVLDGRADVAVHSGKDLPVEGPEALVPFFPERAAPWDVLCGSDLDGLVEGAVVGTGSPRRAAQMRLLRPDVEVVGIRGNVGTRLGKVASGDLDAIVLAEAGLARLGRLDEITHRFSLEEMVPAPAQAALTLEAQRGSAAASALAEIDHATTRRAVESERELLAVTGAGCRSALGAYAVVDGHDTITMTAFVEDEAGSRRAQAAGESPTEVAKLLVERLGL
jgi:hydroxymethylbilane synthase